MTKQSIGSRLAVRGVRGVLAWVALAFSLAMISAPASAQQTGGITGQVTDANGAPVANVRVQASSNVLPQARSVTTASNGKYRIRLLPPGSYQVEYSFPDGTTRRRAVAVPLQQTVEVNVAATTGAGIEEIIVVGETLTADAGAGSLANSINAATVDALPVGQEYRDLLKLIPGVQYSEETTRGPSAGGSGVDNIYQFDGVDVSLPLFGNLASEPSTHDIEQVSIVRGGAKAVGFNRSGGFLINTKSKSGTNEFHGEASFQTQSSSMTGSLDNGDSPASFDEDRTWTTLSVGGPILRDRLFFYGSYYRPDSQRSNGTNAYGAVPDFENIRDEFFGKLTFAPMDNILIDASFRTSEKEVVNDGVGAFTQASAADVAISNQDLSIIEAAWIISDESSINFKYTNFENETGSDPVTFLNITTALGDSLNIGTLDQQGRLNVPSIIVPSIANPLTPADIAFNAFAQPFVDQFGFDDNGVATGGGVVGAGNLINSQDFFRESFEIGFDHLIYSGDVTHDIHIGYKYEEISEVLLRRSNGWGSISVLGGSEMARDGVTPVFFRALVRQQGISAATGALAPPIVSASELSSFEINDTIEVGDWTFNVGVLVSNDALFGQGLRPNANNPSGFEIAIGNRYKMIETDWSDMIQPRLGATWDFNDTTSVYVNYAKYHPPASSLSRAASWDRRFGDRILDVNFDANGNFIDSEPANGSGGKLFEAGIEPRSVDEYLLGITHDFSGDLTLRAHVRHKKGGHFWEDVPNDIYLNANPPAGIAREEIIPGLATQLADLGGGSIRSFVIDELDGAFTKYWEVSAEADWSMDNMFLRGSYTWSHYYGNFDNDNISSFGSDFNSFIGSSSFGDGAGRQVWNNRNGNLRGDRRHQLKLYGYYQLDWNASVGAYFVYQSGQPWEKWQDTPFAAEIAAYRAATGRGTSTSDFLRFAEPAGSRTAPSHWQLDLNYTQNYTVFGDHNIQLRVDVFNAFDRQTGWSFQPRVDRAAFGEPRRFFKPRRVQVAVKYQF
jgi:hypothetical protein